MSNKNKIAHQIALDLGITAGKEEADDEYRSRIIYSALGQILRTVCDDKDELVAEQQGVTKAHLLARGCEILAQYLVLFPECKEWFNDDPAESTRIIRDRLIDVGCIVSDFDGRYHVPYVNQYPIGDDLFLLNGGNDYIGTITSGLGQFTYKESNGKTNENQTFLIRPMQDPSQDFTNMHWERLTIDNVDEYFDPSIRTNKLSEGWRPVSPNLQSGCYVGCRKGFGAQREYFPVKVDDKKGLYYSHFDTYTISVKAYRNYMLYQRWREGNSVKANIVLDGNHFLLEIYSRLADREERVLNHLGWPVNSILQTNIRRYRIELLEYVIDLLNSIGVQVIKNE